MDKKNIISALRRYKSNSAYKDVIKEIGVFGSYATGAETKKSDLDIFLRLEPIRMFDLIGIKEDVEKLFHKKVDLVVIRKSMNQYLKKQIDENGNRLLECILYKFFENQMCCFFRGSKVNTTIAKFFQINIFE